MIQGNRVVVVGMGIESCLGHTVDDFWNNLIAGNSGIRRVESFDPSDLDCQVGAEVWDFQAPEIITTTKFYPRRSDKAVWFAASAMIQALANLPRELYQDTGIFIGSNIVGADIIGEAFITSKERGPARVSPQVAMRAMPNTINGVMASLFGLEGGGFAPASACATGAHAIGEGFLWVKTGMAPAMVVGGAEWCTVKPLLASFANLGALAKGRNDTPEKASRPFDKDRTGFVPGEGAGLLLITTPETAREYALEILCEIIGYGTSYDGKKDSEEDGVNAMTTPTGDGAALCITRAIRNAVIDPDQVDYVNFHATGTPAGDDVEIYATKKSLGKRAAEIPGSSIKGQIGHSLGASGAIESIACVKAIQTGIIPMTSNCDEPDEGCDFDLVTEGARETHPKVVLKNSFGFGRTNASLVFRKWED